MRGDAPDAAITKIVRAQVGNNTLTWKIPKKYRAGAYTLTLTHNSQPLATTKVTINEQPAPGRPDASHRAESNASHRCIPASRVPSR